MNYVLVYWQPYEVAGDLVLVYCRKKCYRSLSIRLKYDVKEEQMTKDKGKGKDKEKKKPKKDAK